MGYLQGCKLSSPKIVPLNKLTQPSLKSWSDFRMTLKNDFVKCSLFVLSAKGWKEKRSKHGLFVFSPKKTLIWRRNCSIGQSCCSMTSKRSIDFFSVRFTNQKPRAFVSVRQNQIALFPFACCFCFAHAFSFQGHKKIALAQNSQSLFDHLP